MIALYSFIVIIKISTTENAYTESHEIFYGKSNTWISCSLFSAIKIKFVQTSNQRNVAVVVLKLKLIIIKIFFTIRDTITTFEIRFSYFINLSLYFFNCIQVFFSFGDFQGTLQFCDFKGLFNILCDSF